MEETWIERAKARMGALKMSQRALAEKLGMTRGAVGHYLSGRRKPDLEQLDRIADALGVQPVWLLYGWQTLAVQEEGPAYHIGPTAAVAITGDTVSGPGEETGEYIHLPLAREHCYGLAVVGDDYAPRLLEGEVLLVCPDQAPAPGDKVVVRFDDGGTALLNLVNRSGEETVFSQLLAGGRHRIVKNRAIVFMHPIAGIISPKLRAPGIVE